jgi:hypothetical protein
LYRNVDYKKWSFQDYDFYEAKRQRTGAAGIAI